MANGLFFYPQACASQILIPIKLVPKSHRSSRDEDRLGSVFSIGVGMKADLEFALTRCRRGFEPAVRFQVGREKISKAHRQSNPLPSSNESVRTAGPFTQSNVMTIRDLALQLLRRPGSRGRAKFHSFERDY